MAVFISHITQDDAIATAVASHLDQHGIKVFLDHLDPEAQSTDEITDVIVNRVEKCLYLLAIITANTYASWWVPFEIGVARHADRRIVTYDTSDGELPEYLTEWPVLSDADELREFAELYLLDRRRRKEQRLAEAEGCASNPPPLSSQEFHRTLKRRLGQ